MKFEFSDYCIQYFPFIDENGDYLVYLNAFCMDSGHPCDSYPVKVKDGGACFWNAKMNVSEKKVISIIFNGEA